MNDSGTILSSLEGVSVISGTGTVSQLGGGTHTAVTSSGSSVLASSAAGSSASGSGITITGTGNGHNVGMSQYGAKVMAELGYTYQDILEFYYTDITIW